MFKLLRYIAKQAKINLIKEQISALLSQSSDVKYALDKRYCWIMFSDKTFLLVAEEKFPSMHLFTLTNDSGVIYSYCKPRRFLSKAKTLLEDSPQISLFLQYMDSNYGF